MKDPHRTGWYQHTKSNNSLLIDGAGQPYSVEAYGWMPRFLQGEEMAYVLGDASAAYSSAETGDDYGLKKFHRHLLLLKPDIIVVYDELVADHPAKIGKAHVGTPDTNAHHVCRILLDIKKPTKTN